MTDYRQTKMTTKRKKKKTTTAKRHKKDHRDEPQRTTEWCIQYVGVVCYQLVVEMVMGLSFKKTAQMWIT